MAAVEAAVLTGSATTTKCSAANLGNTHSGTTVTATERISSYSNSTSSTTTT
jgi:hypothetical protein